MQILSRGRVARARSATFVKVPPQMTGGLRAPYTLCSGQKNRLRDGPDQASVITLRGPLCAGEAFVFGDMNHVRQQFLRVKLEAAVYYEF